MAKVMEIFIWQNFEMIFFNDFERNLSTTNKNRENAAFQRV
jgi:hypothetical protein